MTPAPDYDEAVDVDGRPRPHYRAVLETLGDLGLPQLRTRAADIEQDQRAGNVTFRVTGNERADILSVDLVPRLIAGDEWVMLCDGLAQRARALDAFLRDVYGQRAIVADGIIGADVLDRSPGFHATGRVAGDTVRAHIVGTDLVSDGPGSWMVLEDNLRQPSGAGYAIANQRLLVEHLPELRPPAEDFDRMPQLLLETLRAAAPAAAPDDPYVVLLSGGPEEPAWFEHTFLAEKMGVALVERSEVSVIDGKLVQHIGSRIRGIDVAYLRMWDDVLLSSTGHGGAPLRDGVLEAVAGQRLTLVNAIANGVGDDKAVYPYVPAMIEYYLGEQPKLAQVPTWICAEPEQREHVLANLADMVVKPIDGLGGSGVLIGPDASEAEIEERRRELGTQPEHFIAQEVVALSTHPTFAGDGFHAHHVDLRTFVHLRPGAGGASCGSTEAHVMPMALTRVAARGSRIVNSSSGGSSKATWILDADQS